VVAFSGLTAAALGQAGEMGWRAAPVRAVAAAGRVAEATHAAHSIVVMRDSAVRFAAAHQAAPAGLTPVTSGGRSVVVRRSVGGAADGSGGYDPFEEDAAAGGADRIANRQPAAPEMEDPFETDDAQQSESDAAELPAPQESAPSEPEQPAESEPQPAPVESESPESQPPTASEVEEAFGEPEVQRQPADEPDETTAPDALRDEVEQGATGELVPPTLPSEAEPAMPEVDPDMEEEVPGFDAPEPDAESEEDAEDELQVGPLGELPPLTPEQEEERRRELEKDRVEAEKNCDESLQEVKANGITNISLDIRLKGNPGEDYPFECGLGEDRFQPRSWSEITYLWKASGLCHKPLYFEQVQLERYGHSWGPLLDPIVSGAHFFGTVPVLPYKMGIESPNECIYTLGYYRPGSCAPYMIDGIPFTWRAAAYEAAAVTGGILIFP
jgi:hypothetical protein